MRNIFSTIVFIILIQTSFAQTIAQMEAVKAQKESLSFIQLTPEKVQIKIWEHGKIGAQWSILHSPIAIFSSQELQKHLECAKPAISRFSVPGRLHQSILVMIL
jgi:hypothetical protein